MSHKIELKTMSIFQITRQLLTFQTVQMVRCYLIIATFALLSSTANATTILGMDIDAVAQEAEFIFEGEVIHSETRQESGSGIISTYVTFDILDVIKGDYDADSIELKFMGGVFNGQIVEVSGLHIPEIGEQGVYFLESTSRDLINPLLGWAQGHFLIVEENGERLMSTVTDEPVTNVQAVSGIPLTIKKPQALLQGDNEIAAGVITAEDISQIQQALSVDEFKARIQELLGY